MLSEKFPLDLRGKDGLQALFRMNAKELMKIGGIGRVKAIQMQCVCEFAKRAAWADATRHTKIFSVYRNLSEPAVQ